MTLRMKFDKALRMIGAEKRRLKKRGKKAMNGELMRRLPAIKDGGLVLMPGRPIKPGVPLDGCKHCPRKVREWRF